ncbi:MAG TPA: hypothetical protein VKM54_20615, partial [Myxococcota bacterium]|nr:hypothetical protein [Myxococcota bacterium]
MRRTLAIAILWSLWPASSLGWGNAETHPRLGDAGITHWQGSGDVSFDQYLIEMGLPQGSKTLLAVQTGFDPIIDADLVDNSRGSQSRFTVNFNRQPYVVREPSPGEAIIIINQRCKGAPGDSAFDSCFSMLSRFNVQHLLRAGLFAEDNPNVRSRHHFHDPEKPHPLPDFSGNMGLDNSNIANAILKALNPLVTNLLRGGGFFNFTGRSALDRALNLNGASDPAPHDSDSENHFALPDAEHYLYRALSAAQVDEREHYAALHFLAVGSVLHLLQDMTSTAHVRNDFVGDHLNLRDYLLKQSLEFRGAAPTSLRLIDQLSKSGPGLFTSLPYGFLASVTPTTYPYPPVPLSSYASALPALDFENPNQPFDIESFWVQNPSAPTDLSHLGLAQLVHDRFFSRDTIDANTSDEFGYLSPAVPSCSVLGAQQSSTGGAVWTAQLPSRSVVNGLIRQPATAVPGHPERFLSSALVPHLADCPFHSVMRKGETQPRVLAGSPRVIEESVQRDYLEILFAMTIDYTEKFLRSYLRSRIQVIPVAGSPNQIQLANTTLLPFQAETDAIEIVYESSDKTRWRVPLSCSPTGQFLLAPAPPGQPHGPPSLTCALPPVSSLPAPPRSSMDYWVVVRGELGTRGKIVGATPPDSQNPPGWEQDDYVVAFDHVRPQIAYHGKDPATGLEDIYVVSVDLSHSLNPDPTQEAGPVPVNRTAALRPVLAQMGVANTNGIDFGTPSAEPGGTRLAITSNVDKPQTSGFLPDEPWILDLNLPATDSNAFVRIPLNGNAFTQDNLARWVAWKRGPTPDSVWF